jgi:serine/threonine protein kinase
LLPPDIPAPGTWIDGDGSRWRIDCVLGQGGTAVVCRVTNSRGERAAAKFLSGHRFQITAEMTARFAREIQALGALSSPNVLRLLDVAQYEHRPVAILDLAEESLYAHLQAAGRPPIGQALVWLQELAAGLAAIHKAGYLHRDVSPKNCLFVGPEPRLCLSDLGAARALDDATITAVGAHIGSLIYISPQQAVAPHRAVPSDDVFSLGQIAYEMLTGTRPQGNPLPLSDAQPGLPATLAALIDRLRASDVFLRPSDGTQAAELLTMPFERWLETAAGLFAHGSFADGLSVLQASLEPAQLQRMSIDTSDLIAAEAYSANRYPAGDLPDDADLVAMTLRNHALPDDHAIRLRALRWATARFPDDLDLQRAYAIENQWWEEVAGARSVRWPRRSPGSTKQQCIDETLRNFDHTIQALHATANVLCSPSNAYFYSETLWPSLKDLADPGVRHALISGEFFIAYQAYRERGPQAIDAVERILPSGWCGPLDDLDEDLIVETFHHDKGTRPRFRGCEHTGEKLESRFRLWLRTSCRCSPETFIVEDPNFLSLTGEFPTRKRLRPECPFTKLSLLSAGLRDAAAPVFAEHFDALQNLRYLTEAATLARHLATDVPTPESKA